MRRLYLHGCNYAVVSLSKSDIDSNIDNDYVYLNNEEIFIYDDRNSINIFNKNKLSSDLVCIKSGKIYSQFLLSNEYSDDFYSPKIKFENQFISQVDFFKLINKYNRNSVIMDSNYNKFFITLKGTYNQKIIFYSISNDTDVFVTLIPHRLVIDERLLYDIDFDDLYFKYPYAWIGKLNRPLTFFATDNNDISIYMSIYKKPEDLRIEIEYYKPKSDVNIVPTSKIEYQIIKNILGDDIRALYALKKEAFNAGVE
ncbi:MAG: hypothetical protein QXD03_03770 [Candidatus Anstonellales archaeon]